MTIFWVIGGLALAIAAVLAFFIGRQLAPAREQRSDAKAKQPAGKAALKADYGQAAEDEVEHIFNDKFREELRNRGRLHFEKIIGENAMFLQQDLRLTTSELNEYMKKEITSKLKEEFAKYEESVSDAKDMAIDSITKTNQAIDAQRNELVQKLQQEIAADKQHEIDRFHSDMTRVVNYYLINAIGDQIDLNDQLEYILANLEANKAAMIEDIKNGV
jgi:hypothetical protein